MVEIGTYRTIVRERKFYRTADSRPYVWGEK